MQRKIKIKNWIDVHNQLNFFDKKIKKKDVLSNLLLQVGHLKSPSGSYTKKKWIENVSKIKSYFPNKKKLTILEIGCGNGALLYCFRKLGNIYGVDPSIKLLDTAKKTLPKGKFYLQKAHQINFKKSFFDVVLIYSAIQYFPSTRYFKKVIVKISRILRNNGLLFLGDIPDADQEETIKRQKLRILGKREYKKKYINTKLKHLYLNRSEVMESLSNNFAKIEISNSKTRGIEEIGNRFDIAARKKSFF
ncbi:UbiE Methylase involved in ubiquinone/menaquinone biosynthesis [Candidatus Pelagibacterales bacterium]|jgi:ubiquinone/menaquinone biosynthesis C-methylase UbiE